MLRRENTNKDLTGCFTFIYLMGNLALDGGVIVDDYLEMVMVHIFGCKLNNYQYGCGLEI